MSEDYKNRRKFYRIKFEGKANVEIGDESYDCCQVENLSLSGMFVSGEFKHEQAGNCLIKFIRDDKPDNVYMQANGKIVWGNDKGFGLEFTSMKSDDYQVLITVLINNAELPAIILGQLPKESPFEISDE